MLGASATTEPILPGVVFVFIFKLVPQPSVDDVLQEFPRKLQEGNRSFGSDKMRGLPGFWYEMDECEFEFGGKVASGERSSEDK